MRRRIGIGEGLTAFALPHHRAYGSVHGGSCSLAQCLRLIQESQVAPFDRLLALNETYVHLIQLERETLIRREMRNGLCLFARIRSNEAGSP